MKRPFKKLTAWLCCMAMLISFIPATALPVFADEAEAVELTQTTGVLEAGNYALAGDLTLETYLEIKSEVTIDLAGHSLIAGEGADGALLAVTTASGNLTITDSVGGGKLQSGTSAGTPALQIQAGATATLEGGEITGWTRAGGHGGMVFVASGATFNMEGGKLTDATCAHGAAIRTGGADAVINMSGGEISNCTATGSGPIFLHTDSTFNMTGGTITGNSGATGGAICMFSSGAEVNISGGTISNNTASGNGGAICASYGVVTVSGNAAITGNKATGASSYGGAIFLAKNTTANIEGGTISGNHAYRGGGITGQEAASSGVTINISGGTIENNNATNRGANLYSYDATVNISGGTIGAATYGAIGAEAAATGLYNSQLRGSAVTISGGTIATMELGTGSATPSVAITGNPVIADLSVHANTNPATIGELTEGASVTFSAVGPIKATDSTVGINGKVYTYQKPTVPTSGTVAAGEYVLAADVALEDTLSFAGDTVIDLNGHTITMTKENTVFFNVGATGKLTIKDSVGTGKVQFNTTTGSGVYVSGEFVLESGTLSGYYREGSGALFTVYTGGDFTMTGGAITGNGANAYGLMRAEGGDHTITITGGEITGNWNKSGYPMIQIGKAGMAESTLTIGGDAVLAGNAYGGATFAESTLWTACGVVEITTINTHVVIEDEAVVGYIRADGDAPAEDEAVKSSFTVTGAPTVAGMTWSSSSKTSSQIAELAEGAEVKTYSKSGGGVGKIDTTVVDNTYDNTAAAGGTGTDYDKGHVYTWRDPATVYTVTVGEVVNGTVTVDPAEGVYGTTVTVTATANEGYELEAILVNGKAIAGNTFTIGTANAEVTATFVEAAVEVTYDVIVIDPLGGTVSVDKNEAAEGETITITATADEGYELTAILVNGEAIEGTTFEMPAADVQVTATFTAVEPEGFPTSGTIAAGEYVLTEDVQLTNTLNVTGAVVIDLAGHSIYAKQGEGETASSGIFDLNVADGSLTINDSVGGGKLVACDTNGGSTPAVFVQKGIFTLNAGEITGWVREGGAGGMVYVLNGATFVMNGGKLTGAKSSGDGAIRAASGSTITIAGGEISGNTATGSSIINLVDGVNFTMTGGAIKNNTGVNGGALRIGSGNFTIAGGEISGNTATKLGGGICVVSGASLTLSGVTVEDNACTDFSTTSSSFGGGVYVDNGASLTVNEGTVITGNSAVRGGGISTKEPAATATVTINGGTIEGNHASNRGANLYTYDSALTITGGTIGGALYGADKATAPAATNDFQNVQCRGGVVTVSGGNLAALDLGGNNGGTGWGTLTITGNPVIAAARVKVGSTVTSIGALTTGAVINTTDADALTIAENDETVAHTAGTKLYQFAGDLGLADKFVPGATVTLTEDTSVGGGIVLTEAGTYTLDLAGYTLTGITAPYFTVGSGVKLTITDSSAESTGKVVGLASAANAMILVDGGEFVLEGGTLTGHTNTSYGGAIYVPTAGSVVTIKGGEISGNTAYRGGAISTQDTASAIAVTINIEGGVVTGNATDRGATIYTQTGATLNISSGKVGYGTIATTDAETQEVTTVQAGAGGKEDLWIRSTTMTVTGGDINALAYYGAVGTYELTISGNPRIASLFGSTAEAPTVTIGNLQSGARVATGASNIVKGTGEDGAFDETVNAQARLYRYAGDVKRLLIVGNSFAGDTTNYLTKVAAQFGYEIDATYLYVGSQTVRQHALSLAETLRNADLNNDGRIGDARHSKDELYSCTGFGSSVTIPDVLDPDKNGNVKWDYVVLQPGVEYVGFEGTYNSDIDFLMDYVADVQPEAKIYWSQTWAMDPRSWSTQVNPDAPESVEAGGQWLDYIGYLDQFGNSQANMYNAILANTEKFIAGENARFDFDGWFPIGIAVQTMRDNYTDSYLTRDGFHLSRNAGRMIAALTVVKTLYPETDLSTLTAAEMAAMFDADITDAASVHLNDAFDPTEANVAKLLTAVETACANKATIVDGANTNVSNKVFNPDAAIKGSDEFVVTYENVTELGQGEKRVTAFGVENVLHDTYASAGAGKLVVYMNGDAIATIDELWLEENAGIELTNRYANINGQYYIMADAQAPQLVTVGETLVLVFDVKLYSDNGLVTNGGIHMATSTDGVDWTYVAKVGDYPMAYGLTALSDGTLLMSVKGQTTSVLKLTTAGVVTDTVELAGAGVADVAFAELGDTIYALSSNGIIYGSTDAGLSWENLTLCENFAANNPGMVKVDDDTLYLTWEAGQAIYGKIWTVSDHDRGLGYSGTEEVKIADVEAGIEFNGAVSGAQADIIAVDGGVKLVYASGDALNDTEADVYTGIYHSLALESSLGINYLVKRADVDAMGADEFKVNPGNNEYTYPKSVWQVVTDNGEEYYQVRWTGIAAKEMGDIVRFGVFKDDVQLSVLDYYSIKQYAANKLAEHADAEAGSSGALLRTMLVDMLNYGAAAQTNFSYKTDELVNAGLTAGQKAWASADPELTTNGFVTTVVPCGKNLSLEDTVEINLSYVCDEGNVASATYAKVTYTPHNRTEAVTEWIELVDSAIGDEITKMVKIDTLASADVSTRVTVALYDDKGGNLIEGTTCVYSIEYYAYIKNQANSESNIAKLGVELMKYGNAAKAYLPTVAR